MPEKVRWGVLGAARIALTKVIPAMQRGELCSVSAIASRDLEKARSAAANLDIPKAYGSYEELLADPEIEAVYNPLPNHLHVPWSIRAAEAGKHVLCEKPIALSVQECRKLVDVQRRTGLTIGEAFMVRSHPQWLRARELVRTGEIGDVRSILAAFSYHNVDLANVRNVAEWGGGALYDIGCYPIQISRFLLGQEPLRVLGLIERDPETQIDRLTSAILEFPSAHALFTSGTQLVRYQTVQVLGTRSRIGVEIPFNAPPDRPSRLFIDRTGDVTGSGIEVEEIPRCDQYTIQGDLFSRAIREKTEPPTPLSDSLRNLAVIDAVFESARTGRWVKPDGDL